MSPRKKLPAVPLPVTDLTRRHVLAVTAGFGSSSLAGCSTLIDFIGGLALEDVTVINGSQHSLTGTIIVTGPGGGTRLDERFAVGAQTTSDDNEAAVETDENTVELYQDVLTENGSYTVVVSVETEWLFDDETETEQEVTVAEPSNEHIIVFLQPAEKDTAIAVEVVESFSDLEQFDEEYDPDS